MTHSVGDLLRLQVHDNRIISLNTKFSIVGYTDFVNGKNYHKDMCQQQYLTQRYIIIIFI